MTIEQRQAVYAAAAEWIAAHPELKIPAVTLPVGTKFDGQFGSVCHLGELSYAWRQTDNVWRLIDGPGYDGVTGHAVDVLDLAKKYGFSQTL